MKKSFVSAAIAAALVLGMSACSDPVSSNTKGYDNDAEKLGTEMTDLLGTQLGDQDRVGLDHDQLGILRMQLDGYHSDNFDRDEFVKGFKAGMQMDTAQYAYLYGLRQGLMVRQELDMMAKEFDVPMDVDKFLAAYAKSFADTLSEKQYEELQERMNTLQNEMMTRRQEVAQRRRLEQIEANAKAADEYTAKLLSEGYKQSKSGLVYKIENPGKGPKVELNDQVLLNYTGTHINGREFDSSNGQPVQMTAAGVVPGYREAMMMLGKGGKIRIAVPAQMAYGENGQPRAGIGPNEMLVFDMEIVDILPAEEAAEDDEMAAQRAYAEQYMQQMQAAQASAQAAR